MILLNDVIGHFSWLELLWTGIALVALSLSRLNHSEAKKDIVALAGIRNGRWRIATGNVRRERIRAVIQVAYVAFGILAGQTPASPNPSLAGLIIALGLTVTSAMLALNSYLDRRDRLYLLNFRSPAVAETQNQREDREFGDQRRSLEMEHNEAAEE